MTIALEINLDKNSGRLINSSDFLELTPLWVEFYALLIALKSDSVVDHRYLLSRELRTVGHWRTRKEDSPPKEVSRHIQKLDGLGLGCALEYLKKTEGWRLSASVSFSGSVADIRTWLSNNGWQRHNDVSEFVQWTQMAVKSLIRLQSGNAQHAIELSGAAKQSTEESFRQRISSLLIVRAAQRGGIDQHEDSLEENQYEREYWGPGIMGTALYARWLAMSKYWSRFESLEDEVSSLSKIASELECSGDISGLALIYNTLAILSMRMKNIDAAVLFVCRAIPLLIISGDVINLQSALFNLGHALTLRVRRGDEVSLDEAMALLSLDQQIRRELNVGRDSAQCEILLGYISLEQGDLAAAENYLQDIKSSIDKTKNTYDKGCYHRIKAKRTYLAAAINGDVTAEDRVQIVSELLDAKSEFECAGRFDAVSTVDGEILKIRSGKSI